METGRENFEKAKAFLRKYFSKDSPPPYLTGFQAIYIPDRTHIVNLKSKASASILIKRQSMVVKNIVTRVNWLVSGLDTVDKVHKITLRTMISRIQWTDNEGKQKQLFHSVDETYRQDGVVFAWHPQFDDQANIVMSGLLAYLRTEYGDSVEKYFNEDCLMMQGSQKWDKDKGGILNEDDTLLTESAQTSSWWDNNQPEKKQNRVVVDVSKINTSEVNEKIDNVSLPTVNTKEDNPQELQLPGLANFILNNPVPAAEQNKETATVTSALTLDDVASRMDDVASRMDTYEGSVSSMQTEVAAIHNSMNQNHMLLQAICAKLDLNSTTSSKGPSGNQS